MREKENQSPGGPHNLSENLWPRGGPVRGAHDLLDVRSSPEAEDLQSVGRSNGAPNVNLWPRGGPVLAGAGREVRAATSGTAPTSGETTPCKVAPVILHRGVSRAPMAQGGSGRSGLVLEAHNVENVRRGKRSGDHDVVNVLGGNNVKNVRSAHEAPNDVLRDLTRCLHPTPQPLNPEPQTLHHQPYTPNPKPQTLNPETTTPLTLHPKLQTLDPKCNPPDANTLNPET